MNPLIRLGLKYFLVFMFVYLLALAILGYLSGDEFWKVIIESTLFGSLLSIISILITRSNLNKAGIDNITDNTLKVNQKINLVSKLTIKEIGSIIYRDTHLSATRINTKEDSIKFKIGTSWSSWGEILDIKLVKTNDEINHLYQINSSPRLKTTLVDFGKNYLNIERVVSLLT